LSSCCIDPTEISFKALDSLGRICLYGGAWTKTETSDVYQRGFELFALDRSLEVWLSDCSPAALKLATIYADKKHVLCSQHFRQHLRDAIATFTLQNKTAFWSLAMKVMTWRGYESDADLLQDIEELRAEYQNSRVQELLKDLTKYRFKLCIFHVSKIMTLMRVASSIAESTHSAIKGGAEFKKLLRASNFYESMLHILQLMRIYIDDTVTDLKSFKEKGWQYSPYVKAFIDEAWANMARCRPVSKVSDQEWEVLEDVPAIVVGKKHDTQYTLPRYTQLHRVQFPPNQTHATCSCPEYTQGLRICGAVCAVLMHMGRGSDHKNVSQLHPRWALSSHPLMCLVNDKNAAITSLAVAQLRPQSQSVALSVAPNDVLRLAILRDLIEDVLPGSLKSPHFERLQEALLQHKQCLVGQSTNHEPVFAPQKAISSVHSNRGMVPEQDVVNLSRLNSTAQKRYSRDARGRKTAAIARDSTAYNLHKRGIEGADVQCDCGAIIKNTKRARYYHREHHKGHQEWKLSGHRVMGEGGAVRCIDCSCFVDFGYTHKCGAGDSEVALEPQDEQHVSGRCVVGEGGAVRCIDCSCFVDFGYTQMCGAGGSLLWTRLPQEMSWLSRGHSWQMVHIRPADRLPLMFPGTDSNLRVNQFCEDCREWKLCGGHEQMVSTTPFDFTELHMRAMDRAGYCLVESGGGGDCFYHSMLFLARMYNQALFKKWCNHEHFRKITCDHLLVCRTAIHETSALMFL
jgi:hypothetical protein